MAPPFTLFLVIWVFLFYPVLIGFFIYLYKRAEYKWVFYAFLSAFVVAYISVYIPTVLARWELSEWTKKNPVSVVI